MAPQQFLAVASILALWAAPALAVPIGVINVIPNNQSFETDQNSEPSVAVNPNNANIAVISAFSGIAAGTSVPLQPYYATSNGGKIWTNFINIPHGDTTLDWSTSGNEYMARLFPLGGKPNSIQVQQDVPPYPPFTFFSTAGNSTVTSDVMVGAGTIDQPVISVNNPTKSGAANDHIYVGYNDYSRFANGSPVARLLLSSDGGATWNNAAPLILDPTVGVGSGTSDGNHVVFAGIGNTVYVAYERYTSGVVTNGGLPGNIIVRRDDGGANTFMGLNGANGQAVLMTNTPLTFNDNFAGGAATLGRERLGSDIAIAVDPRDAKGNTVYIAFAETTAAGGGSAARIRLAASTDGGATWTVSPGGFFPNNTALPALSVASNGTIGLEYSRLSGNDLQTHLRELIFTGSEFVTLADFTLSTFNQTSVPFSFSPFIGDYQDTQAVGDIFFGTFSASNLPTPDDFPDPDSVIFQRDVDYDLASPCGPQIGKANSDLKICGAGMLSVALSIDPYFFSTTALVPEPSTLALVVSGEILLMFLIIRQGRLSDTSI